MGRSLQVPITGDDLLFQIELNFMMHAHALIASRLAKSFGQYDFFNYQLSLAIEELMKDILRVPLADRDFRRQFHKRFGENSIQEIRVISYPRMCEVLVYES
jgi:hypothetical protein